MRTTVMIWRNMKLKKIYDRMKVMVIMQQPLYNEIK